eukprot:1129470-Prymnesium_polylepis.1
MQELPRPRGGGGLLRARPRAGGAVRRLPRAAVAHAQPAAAHGGAARAAAGRARRSDGPHTPDQDPRRLPAVYPGDAQGVRHQLPVVLRRHAGGARPVHIGLVALRRPDRLPLVGLPRPAARAGGRPPPRHGPHLRARLGARRVEGDAPAARRAAEARPPGGAPCVRRSPLLGRRPALRRVGRARRAAVVRGALRAAAARAARVLHAVPRRERQHLRRVVVRLVRRRVRAALHDAGLPLRGPVDPLHRRGLQERRAPGDQDCGHRVHLRVARRHAH